MIIFERCELMQLWRRHVTIIQAASGIVVSVHVNVCIAVPNVTLQIVNFSFLTLTYSSFSRIHSLGLAGVGSEYTRI